MRGVRAVVAGGICLGLLLPGPAWAQTCQPSTERARHAMADFVFDAVPQHTRLPAAALRRTAITFAVRTWHKRSHGQAPLTVTVRLPEAQAATPRAGEIWRVYAQQTPQGALRTNACAGTRRLSSLAPPAVGVPGLGFTAALAAATAGVGARRRARPAR